MRCFRQAFLLYFLLAEFIPLDVFAKGYDSIFFQGKGDVAIWSFYEENTGVSFEGGRKSDLFVTHCNGKNKVYIYELGSKGFVCQSHFDDEQIVYGFDLLGLPEKHRAFGVVTASLRKISQQKWMVSSPKKDELKVTRDIAKKHKIKPLTVTECKVESWKGICKDDISSAFGKYSKYEKKLKLKDSELFVIPLERIENGIGWDLSSVVIAKEAGIYSYIGKFDGCLINQPVDIDGDNIPELMTELCENSEGTSYNYFKIYPKVKLLVSSGG